MATQIIVRKDSEITYSRPFTSIEDHLYDCTYQVRALGRQALLVVSKMYDILREQCQYADCYFRDADLALLEVRKTHRLVIHCLSLLTPWKPPDALDGSPTYLYAARNVPTVGK